MQFPPELLKSVAIYHLTTSGGAKPSYPGSANATVTGAFLPLDRQAHVMEGGVFRNPHELYVEATVDLRESDKVVINGTNYFVKSIFNGSIGGLPHKRATVSSE